MLRHKHGFLILGKCDRDSANRMRLPVDQEIQSDWTFAVGDMSWTQGTEYAERVTSKWLILSQRQ
jgi:hypothetical protein